MLLVSDGYYKIKLYKVQFFLERSFRGCHPSNLDNTEVDGTLGLALNVFEMFVSKQYNYKYHHFSNVRQSL